MNTVGLVDVVVVAPEIAPNTGNIIRLCANVGARLHLVEPLGFGLDERSLRRGGLDYHELTSVTVHSSFDDLVASLAGDEPGEVGDLTLGARWFGFAAGADRRFDAPDYPDDAILVFGAEQAGLAPEVRRRFAPGRLVTIPMRPDNRSLNLANAVALGSYEVWRQRGFAGGGASGTFGEWPGADARDRA